MEKYPCHYCQYIPKNWDDLTIHYHDEHNATYKCYRCPHMFKRWAEHQKHKNGKLVDHIKPWPCYFCDETFRSDYWRDHHHVEQHEAILKVCRCQMCNQLFHSEKTLLLHQATFHPQQPVLHNSLAANLRDRVRNMCSTRPPLRFMDGQKSLGERMKLQCNLCPDSSFNELADLYTHCDVEHNASIFCPYCGWIAAPASDALSSADQEGLADFVKRALEKHWKSTIHEGSPDAIEQLLIQQKKQITRKKREEHRQKRRGNNAHEAPGDTNMEVIPDTTEREDGHGAEDGEHNPHNDDSEAGSDAIEVDNCNADVSIKIEDDTECMVYEAPLKTETVPIAKRLGEITRSPKPEHQVSTCENRSSMLIEGFKEEMETIDLTPPGGANGTRAFRCPFCRLEVSTMDDIWKHIHWSHFCARSLTVCHRCAVCFPSPDCLRSHVARVHIRNCSPLCGHCFQCFENVDKLAEHIDDTRSKEQNPNKAMYCIQCAQAMPDDTSALQEHIVSCTLIEYRLGEDSLTDWRAPTPLPEPCPICRWQADCLYDLQIHKAKFHDPITCPMNVGTSQSHKTSPEGDSGGGVEAEIDKANDNMIENESHELCSVECNGTLSLNEHCMNVHGNQLSSQLLSCGNAELPRDELGKYVHIVVWYYGGALIQKSAPKLPKTKRPASKPGASEDADVEHELENKDEEEDSSARKRMKGRDFETTASLDVDEATDEGTDEQVGKKCRNKTNKNRKKKNRNQQLDKALF